MRKPKSKLFESSHPCKPSRDGRITESLKAKLILLLFGAIVMLLVIPRMDAYAAGIGRRSSTGYKFWKVFYVVFFIAIVLLLSVQDSNRLSLAGNLNISGGRIAGQRQIGFPDSAS